ncbi:hypothetical protein, partial [Rhizobium mongolense]|uniref:hypothetical protein n=1 Tax=Rhizobium mongolense TaxID=57676 RepID=UPI001ABFE120
MSPRGVNLDRRKGRKFPGAHVGDNSNSRAPQIARNAEALWAITLSACLRAFAPMPNGTKWAGWPAPFR